jgi:hypothetical protein
VICKNNHWYDYLSELLRVCVCCVCVNHLVKQCVCVLCAHKRRRPSLTRRVFVHDPSSHCSYLFCVAFSRGFCCDTWRSPSGWRTPRNPAFRGPKEIQRTQSNPAFNAGLSSLIARVCELLREGKKMSKCEAKNLDSETPKSRQP